MSRWTHGLRITLLTAARLYLGVVFLMACVHKIAVPESFAVDIATYDQLPLVLINLMALTLPWVELLAGLLLVLGWHTRAAAWLCAGMMVVFIVALLVALGRGIELSCGCFASAGLVHDPISATTVLRDLFWLALALAVALFDRAPLGLDRLLSRGGGRP